MDVFYREFMNVAMPEGGGAFRRDHFQPIPKGITSSDPGIETVIFCDFAKSTNPESDWTALVAVGVSTVKQAIYIWDIITDHLHPDDAYQAALDLATKYNTRVIGREVTGLNEYLTFPFDNYVKAQGRYIEMIDLHARGRKKEDRIRSLISMYRQGWMYHAEGHCDELELELLSFPVSRRDDAADALAYLVEMLDTGGRFFTPSVESEEKEEELEAKALEELAAEEEQSELYDYSEL